MNASIEELKEYVPENVAIMLKKFLEAKMHSDKK